MGAPAYNAPSLQHKEDHLVLPDEVVMIEVNNGRFEPHTVEKIRERAIDMLVNGQLQPVGVKKALDKDKRPQLVFGYLRTLAARYINAEILPKGGVDVDGEWLEVKAPFKLWVSKFEGDDRSSLIKNVVENLSREGTTVMDMVMNQERLLKLNMTEEEVAKIYRTPVENVRRNRQLLSLPRPVQTYIHRGILTAEAGFHLLTVSEDVQKEIIAEAEKEAEEGGLKYEHSEQEFRTHIPSAPNHPKYKLPKNKLSTPITLTEVTPNGEVVVTPEASAPTEPTEPPAVETPKISTASIKRKVRAKKQEKGEKGPALSFSEFKTALADYDVPGEDGLIREFVKKTLSFIKGDLTPKQFENALYKLRDDKTKRVPSATESV